MNKIFIALGIFFTGFSSVQALPKANFSISPSVGVENTEFIIDARDSRNSSGNRGGLYIRCQYFYGAEWTSWSGSLTKKFKTDEIGRHRMKCQIKDRETGNVQTTYRDFEVKKDFVRRVRIEASKLDLTVGEAVFFNLIIPVLTGEDPDRILSRWDFNSDGIWDTKFSRKKVISHSYDKQGQVTPTVEIKFPNGQIINVRGLAPKRQDGVREYEFRKQKLSISAPILYAPIVNISPGRVGFTEKTVFRLDASLSKIPRLGWLEWSVDGQQWLKFPGKKEVSFSFTSPGKHQVRTRTCLGKKNLKCAQTITSISVDQDPLDFSAAGISLQNITNSSYSSNYTSRNINHFVPVEVGDNVRFSVRVFSQGNTGSFLYRWDLNSDGEWDTDFSRNNFTETNFDHLGEYKVTAEVRSEYNVSSTATKKIKVNNNTKPTFYITQNPAKIFVGERAQFFVKKVSSNTDQVRFDIDNDGIWDTSFGGHSSQSRIFLTPGEKIIKAQARDRGKNVKTVSKKIIIYPLPEVKARVIISKKYGKVNEPFALNAIDSSGHKLQYFWGVEKVGKMEIQRGSVKISRIFREPGEKKILLKVIDSSGKQDQVSFSVFVE